MVMDKISEPVYLILMENALKIYEEFHGKTGYIHLC